MPTKRSLSGDAFTHESITVSNTAIGFTTSTRIKAGVNHVIAIVSAEGGMMRYRYDGTNPSSTSGHLLAFGDMVIIEGSGNVTNFKAIRTGDVDGTLQVTYEAVHG